MDNTQFKRLLQIGILVEDVEAAVKHYQEDHGFGPWRYEDLSSAQIEGLLVNGEASDLYLKGAFCSAFGFEIELIQPVSPSVFKTWVQEHGSGLHHLAMETRDSFEDVISQYEARTGKKPWVTIDIGSAVKCAYLDMRDELGAFIEIFSGRPGSGPLA